MDRTLIVFVSLNWDLIDTFPRIYYIITIPCFLCLYFKKGND